MKKRFTLMMMVLCFLMCIPLKMMAETVTPESNYDKITVESNYNADNWGNNSNFNFTTTDGKIYTCVLTNVTAEKIYFRIKRNNDKEWGPESSATVDLVLKSEYQQAYESKSKAFLINTTSGKTTYTITWNNERNQIKYEASEAGGGTGGDDGGSGTPTTNPLTGRVYTQGYYLAGNFFNFSENKVTYDDAVFKFQQQKDDAEGNAVYKVEIPASLTAHAQVMSVDAFGKKQKVYGPGNVCKITSTYPVTDKTTEPLRLTGSTTFDDGTNYWDIQTRNESKTNYSDGMYEVYITVDKTGEPTKWQFKHILKKRVAFFISDAKNATAMPVYDRYKKEANQFSNKFFASVNLSADHSYYVISNYVLKKDNDWMNYTSSLYGTLAPDGDVVSCPTTNKLFLLGNGGYPVETNDQHNEFSPNEKPMRPSHEKQGSFIIEYNCSNGNDGVAKTDAHLGIRGQVIIRDGRTQLTSVSMVGDAIPGTVKDDGTWDYASTAADMTYDETEKCYKVTLVTTAADGEKKFRFVGNHTQNINWHEDSNTDARMMAKTPYDGDGKGHAATSYDPNKVNYTQDGANPEKDWGIIWNRPAGRWTVRLFFYTYSDGNDPVTDYYYTITENKELELRDFEDVVYNSLDNKRDILLRGDYKYFRTWSADKAWKISKDIDIFVVDGMNKESDGSVKFSLTKITADPTIDNYNVIPSNTGVILATKKTADDIAGGASVRERASFTSYNTMVVPMEEYNPTTTTTSTDYQGDNLLKPLITAQVVPTKETTENGKTTYNYLFGFYNAKKGTDVTSYKDNEFLLGFWISKGTGSFYNNSAYLPILEADAKIMGLGVSHNDFDPTSGAKKVPALFFDFANADDTTGIDEVVNTTVKNNDGKYYTLSGLQVEKPTAGGVYIHNGKKFVVR
ncbi:MAG: hypothetical protein MR561_04935 [Prevotella sp.]|nr:hypothetical protein [Prevotella sp.]